MTQETQNVFEFLFEFQVETAINLNKQGMLQFP
jgi:hypothetical protein